MFKYEGDNFNVIQAVKKANEDSLRFWVVKRVEESSEYDMSNTPPAYLASELKLSLMSDDMHINIYYPRWRLSVAIGYYSKSKPNIININGYKVNNIGTIELVSLMYHEFCHYIDANLPDGFYANHGSNSGVGKSNTFQYSVNRYVYEYFNYKKDKPKSKPTMSWYRRLLNYIWRI